MVYTERQTLITGDIISQLRLLPDACVHTIICSPPYFGLRAYGGDPVVWGGDADCEHEFGEEFAPFRLGQCEQTKWKHVDAAGAGGNVSGGALCTKCGAWRGELGHEPTTELFVAHLVDVFRETRRVLRDDGTVWVNIDDSYASESCCVENDAFPSTVQYKVKDLLGIPHMFAFAMRQDGWFFRAESIWDAPNRLPESVTDRPVRSHEFVFLFSKSPRYYYDHVAVLQPRADGDGLRNLRSVWSLNTQPYAGPHTAAFPTALPERCLLASTSARGCCAACGAPYVRVYEAHGGTWNDRVEAGAPSRYGDDSSKGTPLNRMGDAQYQTIGWQQPCSCATRDVVPCTVLDIFSGSGATGVAALNNGRNYIGIDIDPECAILARDRMAPQAQLTMNLS